MTRSYWHTFVNRVRFHYSIYWFSCKQFFEVWFISYKM